MSTARKTLWFLVVLLGLAAQVRADVLVMKDGRRIEGRITLESAAVVRIETPVGELEFDRSDVESIERKKSKLEVFEERWEAAESADQFFALGEWCLKERMRKQARRCMERAVEVDPMHAGANTWLGFVLYRGEWMTPEERDARMKADEEAEMRARGLVQYEGRWVTPEEQAKLEQGLVELEDGRWLPFDEAQRARGLELFEGAWRPRVEALALQDADAVEEVAGVRWSVALGPDLLVAGEPQPEVLERVVKTLGVGRGWFDRALLTEPGLELLGGRMAEFYLFETDARPYRAAIPYFAQQSGTLPEGWAEAVERVHGFVWWDPFPISVARQWHREPGDLEGHCYHHWGHMLLNRLAYDGRLLPPWYDEGFAALLEFESHGRNAVFCRAQTVVGRGTSAKRAEFDFDPKDLREGGWRDVVKKALRANRVRSIDKLAQLEFGELELLDVAVSMGILEWVAAREPEALRKFHLQLRAHAPEVPHRILINAHERQAANEAAFQAGAGTGWREADRLWREWFLAR